MTEKPRAAVATAETTPRCVMPAKPTTVAAITDNEWRSGGSASERARSERESSGIPSASAARIAMHQHIGYEPMRLHTTPSGENGGSRSAIFWLDLQDCGGNRYGGDRAVGRRARRLARSRRPPVSARRWR